MKDIAYRAKLADNTGDWVFGYPYRIKTSWYICDRETGESHLVRASTVCEWSGARDIFGTPIHEQDILKSPTDTSHWRVTFDDGRFLAIRQSDRKTLTIKEDNIAYYQLVVVGNAYDTPDLLG